MPAKQIDQDPDKLGDDENGKCEIVPGSEDSWTIYLRKDKKGRRYPVRIVLTDFHYLAEGLSPEERDKFAQKYTVPQFKIFQEGCTWMLNKLHPKIMELRDENQQLHQQISGDAERNYMKRLMAEHRRGGKPNWSAIGRVLKCDPKTAEHRADRLGLL